MEKPPKVEKKKKKRKKSSFIFKLLILGLLIFLIITNIDFFLIQDISVIGNDKVISNKIELFSAIEKGENIFKINKRAGEEHILDIAYIKSVDISRKLPDGILIEVEERKDRIQIIEEGNFIILDREGFILENRDRISEGLLDIEGFYIGDKTPGVNAFVDTEEQNMVELIKISEEIELLSNFKEINLTEPKNIHITLQNYIEVEFGPLNNIKYKLDLLNEIIDDIVENKINTKLILMNKGENPIVVLEED